MSEKCVDEDSETKRIIEQSSNVKLKNEQDDEKEANVLIEENEKLESDSKNLYAYLDRDDYTTEKFKIEIRGLPKFYGIGELKKFLNEKLSLNASKIKPPKRGSGWAYVCFRSKECQEKAISALHGIEWKRAKLTAQVSSVFEMYLKISLFSINFLF